MASSNFYIGRLFDLASGKLQEQNVELDPSNLTTHAIITGMTGSGKTGLGVILLEEAALHNIPAIILDPKGDLTNLVLHFPDFLPTDFEPWLDPESARRLGKPLEEVAAETATRWKDGLASWGLGSENVRELAKSAQYTIFTPGSSSGKSVNILSSFAKPDQLWDPNRETLREKIATIVTALLNLVGVKDIDPLRSREHILLCNLLENAWSQGRSLDLTELILEVQNPPFDRLGAFPLDNFFPPKDRFDLAMLLNSFLASPSFQSWLEGQPLDIGSLLYTEDNRPRHSIFYTAHLSENERMFFTTLLFASIESWMRAQRGTSGLRLLIYFDEIMGYLPPVANPPSRVVMLRMLKQARAFGVGIVLSTQNPVDVDYKALSNAGIWMIGRLQTQQDKDRLLDGLRVASGTVDPAEYDRLISSLGKRTFVFHNVHKPQPVIFQTRYTMNYLAGPLMRTEIPQLNQLAGVTDLPALSQAAAPAAEPGASSAPQTLTPRVDAAPGLSGKPSVPAGVSEIILPTDLTVGQAVEAAQVQLTGAVEPEGILYRPTLLAQAEIRYLARKYNLEHIRQLAVLLTDPGTGLVRWEDFTCKPIPPTAFASQPLPDSRFETLPNWLSDAKRVKTYESDFTDWVYRTGTIRLRANEALGVYASPETSPEEFRKMCHDAVGKAMQADLDKIETTHKQKLAALQSKIKRQSMEVESQEKELNQRRLEEAGAGGEFLLSVFGGRKRSLSTNLTKRRLTAQAKQDLEQELAELEELEAQLKKIEEENALAVEEAQKRWQEIADQESEIPVTPYKKDIYLQVFSIAWLPHYLVRVGGALREIPAISQAV